jgi:hypothetical protein
MTGFPAELGGVHRATEDLPDNLLEGELFRTYCRVLD